MKKNLGIAVLALPDEATTLPYLFEPPRNETDTNGMLELETELMADQPDADPMPDYIQDMFEVAGVPRSIGSGESLQWFNGCRTSVKYESACAQVAADSSWFELRIVHQSGRSQRLRCSRYGDLVALDDSVGIEAEGLIQTAVATFLLEFKAASRQLMVKH